MKKIDIKVQIVEDNFKNYRADAEKNLISELAGIIKHIKGQNTVSLTSDFQILIARQITYPSKESLSDLHINPGEFLILYRPAMSSVKLALHFPKQLNIPPLIIDRAEVLIGRGSEYQPDIDLTPYLQDPDVVSRKVARIWEEDGKWLVELEQDCHSGLFLDEIRLLPNSRVELHDRAVLSFGPSLDRPDLKLGISLTIK